MGYSSDVGFSIQFRDKKTLNEYIALVMMKGGEEVTALRACQIDVSNYEGTASCINFFASDVKWYESYTEVLAFTWLYRFAVQSFPEDCAYKFVRIGEEQGDVEEDTGGNEEYFDVHDGFYTYTKMETPFDADYLPIGDALGLIEEPVKT